MAVRNFYATIQNDNHGKPVATGPIGKDEGFTVKIQQRMAGDIITAYTVLGDVRNGQLILSVLDSAGVVLQQSTTNR